MKRTITVCNVHPDRPGTRYVLHGPLAVIAAELCDECAEPAVRLFELTGSAKPGGTLSGHEYLQAARLPGTVTP